MIRRDTLFFVGFIPYLINEMLKTTMFGWNIHGPKGVLFTFLCLGLMILKVMLYDHFTIRQLVLSAIMVVVGVLTYFGTGKILYFALMVLIISAKDISFDKIIKVWLVIIIAIMLMAYIASRLDIITDLQYTSFDLFSKKKIIRNSFGIIYPTDFAAHIFFCVLSLFYLRRDSLKWYDYFLGITTGFVVYYFCRAKLDTLSMVLTVLLFFGAFVFKHNEIWNKIWRVVGPIITPAACIVMTILTCSYKKDGSLEQLNYLLSGRLFYGRAGIDEYGLTLLGQKLKLVGHGGSTDIFHYHYNFLDVSYINILVTSGLVFLVIFMLIYSIMGYVHRKNTFLLCALFMVALNCAIAHHMTAIEYNVFTLALFATVVGKEYENKTP